jgi:hypothetical protein
MREPRTTNNGHPVGNESMYRDDHRGISAEAAPKRVAKPNTSVSKVLVFELNLCPTKIPNPAPPMIATTLMSVPIPGNIVEE